MVASIARFLASTHTETVFFIISHISKSLVRVILMSIDRQYHLVTLGTSNSCLKIRRRTFVQHICMCAKFQIMLTIDSVILYWFSIHDIEILFCLYCVPCSAPNIMYNRHYCVYDISNRLIAIHSRYFQVWESACILCLRVHTTILPRNFLNT